MLQEKAKDYFEKYPEIKLLFFFDEEKKYLEEVDNWSHEDIKLIKVNNSLFALKYQLEYKLKEQKIFLYFTYPQPKGNERKLFPLMDLLIANRVLHIDPVEDFIQQYELKPYQRNIVKKYISFLDKKMVQKTLTKILKADSFDENQIQIGLICHFLGLTRIEDETIILTKLFTSLLSKNKKFISIIENIKNIDGESYICRLLDDYFNIQTVSLNEENVLLAVKKLKYNIISQNISRTLQNDNYSKKLKIDKPIIQNRINTLINDWIRYDSLSHELDNVFDELASDVNENEILKIYGIDNEYGYYTNNITFGIIEKLIDTLEFQPEKSTEILSNLANSIDRNKNELKQLIEFLIRSANVYKLLNSVTSYILDKPIDYLSEYVKNYEAVDYNYRKAIQIFNSLTNIQYPSTIPTNDILQRLNKKHEDHLKELNTQWLKCMEDHDFEFYNIPVVKQFEFYKKYIEDSDQKVAVIISDGLRYEAANELLNTLFEDPKHQAEISFMLSSLPSNTKLGMSNLLPNKELELKNESYFINDCSTEGLENREKILQQTEEDSKVISFDKLVQLNQDESRALFKSKIVYIYHNQIDAIGDDRKTENQTFEAVEKTINELVPMIKKIHSSYNVSKVYITADHGFLYNYNDLSESMYQTLPDNKNAVINHNRFSILKGNITTDSYLFDLKKASNIISDYKIAVPKAINRYKRQGHGVHYVHGGASLQEMIIPLIESNRKREEITEKVSFKLLSRDLKLVSGAIKIKLIQDKSVDSKFKPIEISIGIYKDSDEIVTNEVNLILDSTSDLPTERVKEVILNLKGKYGSESMFFLMIYDKQKDPNKLNPIIKEKVINQTLIQPDFE